MWQDPHSRCKGDIQSMKKTYNIPGYKVIKKLGESIHAEVFKVQKKGESNSPLILKRIKPGISSKDIYSFLNHQIDYLKHLNLKGAIVPTLHERGEARPFLVQEYFDGINLSDWRKSRKQVSLKYFFEIGCSLAKILDGLHNAGHIHGGIKPNNILIAPGTLDIRLIDLVRIFDMSEISHFIYDKGFNVNTINYISPEQTGRIKQRVDFTTDLYSLGIVLYELLSGTPPFLSSDPLEIIYSHLAEDPMPLHEKCPEVPEIVGHIIGRLMNKEPERRYQTCRGLLNDLEACKEEYLETGKIVSFTPGLKDYSNRINIPSIMVGRDKEKELLLKEHSISLSGSFRAAIVSGLPGIGKTRLIQELQIPIVAGRGYFTSGKFDQYQKISLTAP